MNIIENYDEKGIYLSDVEYGDVFQHDGSYYLRCDCTDSREESIQRCLSSGKEIIVNLANGKIVWLMSDTRVIPIYARIRINGRAD